ncbi:trp operon leader peptide [Vibrio sagamiensis]|nr:trp operon leader peptide [Vibrio sagamiensis]PNQ70949.1 Trp operon leader peptide [Vibrio agarivorans]
MLQEFVLNQNAKIKVHDNTMNSEHIAWWRIWTSSCWADVYF